MAGYHNRNGSSNFSFSSFIDFDAMAAGYYSFYSCIIFFGVSINTWMLLAFLTSPEMRSHMRIKILCMLLFNNVIKCSVVVSALFVSVAARFGGDYDCSLYSFVRLSRLTVICVENWFFLLFLVCYIFALQDYDLTIKFSPKIVRAGTILLLVFPWVFSLIVGPSVMVYHSHVVFGFKSKGCISYTYKGFRNLQVLNVVVPFFAKIALLIVILILHRIWKIRRGNMPTALIGRDVHIDDVRVYVLLCFISAITKGPVTAQYLVKIPFDTFLANFIFTHSAFAIVEAQSVLMPPCFLFFSDLRTRLKTWRPWNRHRRSIDLDVRYNKE